MYRAMEIHFMHTMGRAGQIKIQIRPIKCWSNFAISGRFCLAYWRWLLSYSIGFIDRQVERLFIMYAMGGFSVA